MKKILYIFLLMAFSGQPKASDLGDFKEHLNGRLPTIQEQIQLYRDIYTPHNHPDFEANTTHVPGFGRILPMAYAYAFNHPDMTEREHGLLDRFWQETVQDFHRQAMTIPHLKKTLLRLGFLMGQGQKEKGSLFFSHLSATLNTILRRTQEGDWDLGNFKEAYPSRPFDDPYALKAGHFPFCFEAIVLHPHGDLELDDFLRGYLDETMPISLSALPYEGLGPHNDTLIHPGIFLFHDYVHWSSFHADMNGENLEKWRVMRGTLSSLYQNGDTTRLRKVGLFFMLHEYPGAMGDDPSEVPEKMLYDWVKAMKMGVAQQGAHDATDHYMNEAVIRLWDEVPRFYVMANPATEDSTYSVSWAYKKVQECLEQKTFPDFQVVLDYENVPSDTPGIDFIRLIVKDFHVGPHVQAEIQDLIEKGYTDARDHQTYFMAPTTTEDIQSAIKGQLKDEIFPFINSRGNKDFFFKDVAKLINYGYGYEAVKIEATAQEISQAFNTFMDQFLKESLAVLGQTSGS